MITKNLYAALVVLSLFAGCSSLFVDKIAQIELSIRGDENMNGGAPAKIKIYYLNSGEYFEKSDFFELFEDPQGTLKDTLISVVEYQMAPDRTLLEVESFEKPPKVVGVVAAYRQLDEIYKSSKDLEPKITNSASITLIGNNVVIN